MPGYTHLQRAQPVYLSHHLLAYFWKFRRDLQRFNFCLTATDDLPLGAGALAGVNFDTSRMFVAQELGFGGIAENSLDAVSNRDFVLDYLSAAATCATHLSQLGAEIVLWSSEEFGFCEVADRFASGLEPDAPEEEPRRRRAAARQGAAGGRAPGHVHGVLHGLPLTYNKDLQEDKEQLFDAIDTVELCLAVADRDARRHRLRPRAHGRRGGRRVPRRHRRRRPAREARRALPRGPRRRRRAGRAAAVERGKALSELTEEELAELAPELGLASSTSCCATGLARVQGLRGRHLAGPRTRPARPGPPHPRETPSD